MVGTKHFVSPASLPTSTSSLSVLSYNVLLPNSQDGWWNYKMYNNHSADLNVISSWDYRKRLLKDRIQLINPDIVCMQEVSPISFEDDFAFMKEELGYDGNEMFKRGRFRPATFWKSSKCFLVSPPVHNFQNLDKNHPEYNQVLHVLNCHLQAGPEGKRRLRQIDEGVKACVNLSKKLKEEDHKNPLLIVCGDFNGGSECGAVQFLETGSIGPSFIEDGGAITSKDKKCPLDKPLFDITHAVDRPPPPTLVVAELISQMVSSGQSAYEEPTLSDDMVSRLTKIYAKYATKNDDLSMGINGRVMDVNDVQKWLVDINKHVGRGSEFRSAAKEMGYVEPETNDDENSEQGEQRKITLPVDGILSLAGFLNVYQAELRAGKFWGISYDLKVMGEPLPDKGIFEARYDRMYCSSTLKVAAILDTLSLVPCPNEVEPSDHLPVAATFEILN